MRRVELERMHNEMKALRSALAVYADAANWSVENGQWVLNMDLSPNTARKALNMGEITPDNHNKVMKAEEQVKPGKNQWKKPD